MKTKFNSKKVKLSLLVSFVLTAVFSFNMYSQLQANLQYNLINAANNQFASLEFSSRESSFGCCGVRTIFTPIIEDGGRLEAETATRNRFSAPTLEDFQKWKFVSLGNNIYQIINVRSGRAVDVQNNNALPLQQQPNRSDVGQQWRVIFLPNNQARFVSVLSGKAISFNRNGILVQREVRNGNRRQLWTIRTVEPSPVGDPTDIQESLIIAPNPASTSTTLFISSNVDDPNAYYEILVAGASRGRVSINLKRGLNEIPVDVSGINARINRIDIFIQGRRRYVRSLVVIR